MPTKQERYALQRLYGRWYVKTRYNNKKQNIYYGECPCGYKSNSRRDAEVARADMMRHAQSSHRGKFVKHLRDVERTMKIGRTP